MFSYGNRFDYNQHINFRKNRRYVGCLYENLKKELVDDPIKEFSVKDWNALIESCYVLLQLPHSKRLKSRLCPECDCNPKREIKGISLGRIIAIRLYCSRGTLASQLTSTYLQSGDYADDKRRHSRYGHWAKLLTTTCDRYGIDVDKSMKFYRGLNKKFVFKSGFSSQLYGPISTTLTLGVAAAFAGDGIILEISKASWCDSARYFDCTPYSTYKHEREFLFDGHNNYLDVTAVKTNMGFRNFDTKPVLLLQALTSKCEIKVSKLVDSAPIMVKGLAILLKKYLKPKAERKHTDYLFETIDYYLSHNRRLELSLQRIEEFINICDDCKEKSKSVVAACKELLGYFFINADIVIEQKVFSMNINGMLKLFPSLRELTIQMQHTKIKLNEDINEWNSFLEYLNNNSRKGKKIMKIGLKKLRDRRFPSDRFLMDLKRRIITKWHIYTGVHNDNAEQMGILFLYGSNATTEKTKLRQLVTWKELNLND